jgi:tetratricopeptide (TPR) repeat protein
MELRKSFSRIGIALCLSSLLLALGSPAAMAQMMAKHASKAKMPRDNGEALQWVQDGLAKSGYRINKIDSQYLLYGNDKGNYGIALARVVSTSVEYSGGYTYRVFWQDYAHENREAMEISPRHAGKFSAALEYLAANARQQEGDNDLRELAQFREQSNAWRSAAVKPSMPDDAREHQVLAEFAFKEKNADKAISEYSAALSVFPTWPEGQYNLAMLAGEKKMYDVAIKHMKYYLELAPDSADAQAAKDAVIIWKDKLQTVLSSAELKGDADHGHKRGGSAFLGGTRK